MSVSKEQAEADEALAMAIRNHAEAYDLCMPGELLGDYAVIANWQPPVDDSEESRYTVAFHRPRIPDHVARGLFHTGLAHLDYEEYEDDD